MLRGDIPPAADVEIKQKEEKIMEVLGLFGILGYFSVEDLRYRRLRTVGLLSCAIAGILLHIRYGRISVWDMLGGMAIGLFMYLVAVISSEKIGKGDALLLMVTGIFLGFSHNLILLWAAAVLAGAAGFVSVFILKKGHSYELPFVPFLFASYIICLILWGGRIG